MKKLIQTGFSLRLAILAVLLLSRDASLYAEVLQIEMVRVGNGGNAADTTGYGAVHYEYQIGKYEVTNNQYAAFLNAVDPEGINPNSIWSRSMGSFSTTGITNTGTTNGSRYAVKPNMGDKPVVYVTWFDAARLTNWLHNGASTYSKSDASANAPQNVGAYTLSTATYGAAPSKSQDARFWIPTENEWYKAAFYSGSGIGYLTYGDGFGTTPTPVTSGDTGIGSAGAAGNFVNYRGDVTGAPFAARLTTVGTNGGPSHYGAFDMSGNAWEWNDLNGLSSSSRGIRGGSWNASSWGISREGRDEWATGGDDPTYSFRIAAVAPIPEPSTWVMAWGGVALLIANTSRRYSMKHRTARRIVVATPNG